MALPGRRILFKPLIGIGLSALFISACSPLKGQDPFWTSAEYYRMLGDAQSGKTSTRVGIP